MKIAFLITNMTGGGAARATASLANNFITKGLDVLIIKLDGDKPYYNIDNRIEVTNLNIRSKSRNYIESIKNNLNRIIKLREICNRYEPTILICMNITMLYLAIFSFLKKGIKIVGTERSNPYLSLRGSFKKGLKKIIPFFADGFIFQTNESTNFYSKAIRNKGIVIPNAVYDQRIYDLEFPKIRKKVITSVGRLIESKGFDFLIRAFSEVKKEFPDYTLVIYGEGPYRKELEILIRELKLEDSVFLKGQIFNVNEKIYNASLFVFPSRHEGMPNALIEALACGLPCISTDCKMGPKEVIESGVNGIIIEVDDIIGLKENMILLLRNLDMANKLGENAIKIREKNSINMIAKMHINYFKDLFK